MQQPIIHDPSCGGAAFLRDCGPAALAALIAHATPGPDARPADAGDVPPCPLIQRDSLSAETRADERRFPIIVTNPPFGGATGSESDARGDKNTAKTELLFLFHAIEKLPAGARACMLVPPNLLFGSGKAQVQMKRTLIEMHRLEAIINLPGGVFRPHSGIASSLVIFRKGLGPTDRVWMANVRAVGYSLDGKRRPVAENDLPEILRLWRERHARAENVRTSQAFFVDVGEIRDQEYNLSFGRYQEITFEREETPPLDELMRDILRHGRDAERHMLGLASMIGLDLQDLLKEGLIDRIPDDFEEPSLRLVYPSDGSDGMEGSAGESEQPDEGGAAAPAPPAPVATTPIDACIRVNAAATGDAPALHARQDDNGLWVTALDRHGAPYAAVYVDFYGGRLTLKAWDLKTQADDGAGPSAVVELAPDAAAAHASTREERRQHEPTEA